MMRRVEYGEESSFAVVKSIKKEGEVEAEGRYSGISDGDRQLTGSEERE